MSDAKQFRDALGQFATGVTIVTTRAADGTPIGVTANSYNSVSLDPPLVLWSLAKSARSIEAFQNADAFAIHILGEQQQDSRQPVRFSRRGQVRRAGDRQRAWRHAAPARLRRPFRMPDELSLRRW